MEESVGFIGLGRMGRPRATNLLRKGSEVLAYDIDPHAVAAVVRHGAEAAASVADVARSSSILFTVLPTHVEVEQVLLGPEGVVGSARPDTLVVEMSTVAPTGTDRIAAVLADAGMRFVDAPIGRLASHADRGECLSHARARGWGEKNFSARLDALCESCGAPPVRLAPGRNRF